MAKTTKTEKIRRDSGVGLQTIRTIFHRESELHAMFINPYLQPAAVTDLLLF